MRGALRAPAAVSAAAILLALLQAAAGGRVWLALPATAPFLVWLPGRAVVGALFGAAGPEPVARATFSVAVSLAVGVVVAVELAAFGALTGGAWVRTLAVVTLVAVLVWAAAAHGAEVPPRRVAVTRRGTLAAAVALAALGLVGGAVALARQPASAPADRGYTLLGLAPPARADAPAVLTVRSDEATVRAFTLTVRMPGVPPASEALTLAPGQTVQRPLTPPPGATGQLEVTLTVPGHAAPYRRVRLRLPAAAPADGERWSGR